MLLLRQYFADHPPSTVIRKHDERLYEASLFQYLARSGLKSGSMYETAQLLLQEGLQPCDMADTHPDLLVKHGFPAIQK